MVSGIVIYGFDKHVRGVDSADVIITALPISSSRCKTRLYRPENASDKDEQISSMDAICRNAQRRCSCCREGLGLRASWRGQIERQEQAVLKVGDHTFLQTFPRAADSMNQSKWATRGWTFQEGLLSKRRLIFTDCQIAFQCGAMHCSEAVCWPFEVMHNKSGQFPARVPDAPFRSRTDHQDKRKDGNSTTLAQYITEYSRRSLSCPSDRMNAFLGILNTSLPRQKNPIYPHLWGVPVIQSDKQVVSGLNWPHQMAGREAGRLSELVMGRVDRRC